MFNKLISIIVFFCLIFGLTACVVIEDPISDTNQSSFGSATPSDNKTIESTVDNASLGEKNALRSAKNYLSIMAFSYSGLIRQLEFEKYTTEEATYAADNCGADWNEQALKKAKNYFLVFAFLNL